MKKIVIYLFVASIGLLSIISCEKEHTTINQQENVLFSKTQDEILHSISMIVAKAQENAAFRSIVYHAAKKNYGNEQTAFFARIKDHKINDGLSLQDLLATEATKLGLSASLVNFEALSQRGLAKLSFTLYDGTNANDLSTFNYQNPIPVLAEDRKLISEEELTCIAYDIHLNPVEVSNTEDPDFALLVVENNQSFVLFDAKNQRSIDGAQLSELLAYDLDADFSQEVLSAVDTDQNVLIDGMAYQLLNPNQAIAYINEQQAQDPDRTGAGRSCNRDSRNGKEAITGVNVVHSQLKTFCKWYKKDCRLEINTIFAANPNFALNQAFLSNLPKKYIIGKRKDMKNDKNYAHTLVLYQWEYQEGNHGDRYVVDFVGKHHNPDGSSTFSIGITPKVKFAILDSAATVELTIFNATYSTTKANNDTNLGGDLIQYCESIDIIPCSSFGSCGRYNSGSIKFWITKQN